MATRSPAPWSGPAPGRAELILRRALLLAAAFGLVVSGNALARVVTVEPGLIEAHFSASLWPEGLSRKEQTPAVLRAGMKFSAVDGSPMSHLEAFEIGIDRHLRLNLEGVPVCHGGNVDEPPPRVRCKEALVGTGTMVTYIHFPEQAPVAGEDEIEVFNSGRRNGVRTLRAVAYVTFPTPTELILPIAVERDHGRFGLKLVGSVPKIAGGSGEVLDLGFRFRKGIFSGTCRDRHLDTRFDVRFKEGAVLGGAVERACRMQG